MLDRREFQKLVLALLAGSAYPLSGASAAVPASNVILNRLTFGASAASRAEFESMGLASWLEEQLAASPADEGLEQQLQAARLQIEYEADRDGNGHHWRARKEDWPYQYLSTPGQQLLKLIDYDKSGMSYEERIRPAREVQAASLIRAVHGKYQLRELMTQFWHDHFNVNAMKDEHTAAYFSIYDTTLRSHALGNFRQLLGAVTRSPSMLFYLNNEASRASPANENFARELFELHTLGAANYLNDSTTDWHQVPGAAEGLAKGYIDQDVYEAARALTGWSFGDGRWIAEGENAPESGEFFYNDRWHDPYQKRILAVEFKANAAPMADGEKLLDLLASHPATAGFVCTKICRRLLHDEPPQDLVDKAAAVWMENIESQDQIAKVIRTVVMSPQFAQTPPSKLKRPFEFLASLLRAANASVTSPGLDFVWALARAGWSQHECRPPTGHSDVSTHWANTGTLNTYVDLALYAFEDWSRIGKVDLAALFPATPASVADACTVLVAAFRGTPPAPAEAADAAGLLAGDAAAPWPGDPDQRSWLTRGLIAMAVLSPGFLFR